MWSKLELSVPIYFRQKKENHNNNKTQTQKKTPNTQAF